MDKIEEIIKFGKLSENYRLISSHSGNISIKDENYLYITKTGTMLGNLKPDDIIKLNLYKDDENLRFASMETIVHKAIYNHTKFNAILHTHPIYAITLSLLIDNFIPVDSEGKLILNSIPILKAKKTVASSEVAEKIPVFLKNSNIVIIRGHGVFAGGETLEKAFYYTSVLENSAKIYYLTKLWISSKHS